MKSLIKKIINKSFGSVVYTTFITLDGNSIAGAIYKGSKKEPTKHLIAKAYSIISSNYNTESTKDLLTFSLAKCLDELEEKSKHRINQIELNLIGFNSKSFKHREYLKEINNTNINNILKGIDFSKISDLLDQNYILTNLVPLKVSYGELNREKNTQECTIDFLVTGYKKSFILEILDIFYNFSIEVNSIIYSPLTLPFIFKNEYFNNLVFVASNYTLLYTENHIDFIPLGTNKIFDKISNKTNIPIDVLQNNSYVINQVLLEEENSLLFRIEEFVIDNIKNIVNLSLEEYLNELVYLITSKVSNNHDKIVIVNNNLKFLKEHNLLNLQSLLNMEFKSTYNINKFLNHKPSNTEVLNNAAVKYYTKKVNKDLALINFRERISKIVKIHSTEVRKIC